MTWKKPWYKGKGKGYYKGYWKGKGKFASLALFGSNISTDFLNCGSCSFVVTNHTFSFRFAGWKGKGYKGWKGHYHTKSPTMPPSPTTPAPIGPGPTPAPQFDPTPSPLAPGETYSPTLDCSTCKTACIAITGKLHQFHLIAIPIVVTRHFSQHHIIVRFQTGRWSMQTRTSGLPLQKGQRLTILKSSRKAKCSVWRNCELDMVQTTLL